jgi:hypothetical protein
MIRGFNYRAAAQVYPTVQISQTFRCISSADPSRCISASLLLRKDLLSMAMPQLKHVCGKEGYIDVSVRTSSTVRESSGASHAQPRRPSNRGSGCQRSTTIALSRTCASSPGACASGETSSAIAPCTSACRRRSTASGADERFRAQPRPHERGRVH